MCVCVSVCLCVCMCVCVCWSVVDEQRKAITVEESKERGFVFAMNIVRSGAWAKAH